MSSKSFDCRVENMLYEDPRNRCCCAIRVQTGAIIVAGFGLFFALVLLVLSLVYGRFLFAVIPLLLLVGYGSIFYAHYARSPRLYWPFLTINGIVVAGGSLYILVLLGMFLLVPHFWQRWLNEFTDFQYQDIVQHFPRLVTAGICALMLVVQVMNIWFELVVYNASTYVLRERFAAQNVGYKV